MKAVGYQKTGPIEARDALIDFDAPTPTPGPKDLLVEIKAVSVNPVDTKVRVRFEPEGSPRILGYDAAGIVKEIGSEVTQYKVGDAVFYAGALTRNGTNAEFHIVDERIVGRKPESLADDIAAGMPLTAITAWELMFDSLHLEEGGGDGESILIIGGAGGVGSILIQLVKKLTKLSVIATASRPDTIEWVQKMGADHVVNHHHNLAEEMKALNIQPKYVAALNGTTHHFDAILELIKPRGHMALIDDPDGLDIMAGKQKSLSFSWEFMFTRSMMETDDMHKQQELLNRVSHMLDSGDLIPTVTQNLGKISAKNLIEAHRLQESGRVIGKNVLSGF